MTVHPLLYEVHSRQWLAELGVPTLDAVADETLAELAGRGVTHLWLMGAWAIGPRTRAHALADAGLRESYDLALPGWTDDDVRGSPYAIADYQVAADLGGDRALAALRARLRRLGVGVILDFVPNHTGLDHGWLVTHPERFVSSAQPFADSFPSGGRFVAHGKDPYFPGWIDTAQLDYRRASTRAAMSDVLASIAERCDGVRCDMAMLVLGDVFARTWQQVPAEDGGADADAPGEFWAEAIARVRRTHGGFLFLAEAYWGLEGRLCDLGFDHAYDKELYDLVVHDRASDAQPHLLGAGLGREVARRAHFLENHDEPRAAATMSAEHHRAAALLTLGLPGLRLLHHGQLTGARRFARIQLGRRADEPADPAVVAIYEPLLAALAASPAGKADGQLLAPRRVWDDNPTADAFTVVQWQAPGVDDRFDLVVVNLAAHRSQCRVVPRVPGLAEHTWQLADRLGPERWLRDGRELATTGLFLDLPPRDAQLFAVRRALASTVAE
ncbi:MAG TPA: alpha-amylase family glycosyl hydrolase [Kofleriaceae bacterium]|nr:alpha-amylase family glycosyl hydrolase [Kofleriaceae bacterium]